MNAPRTLATLWLVFLSLWLAVVFAAALSASVTFTVLPPLEPYIPGYDVLEPDARGRLVAGLTTEPVFLIADWAQLALCPLTILIVVLQGIGGLIDHRRVAQWVRLIGIGLAGTFFMGRLVFVNPPMNEHLQAYRTAATEGDLETAQAEQATFNGWHHVAEPLWGLTGLALLVAIGATGPTLVVPTSRRHP